VQLLFFIAFVCVGIYTFYCRNEIRLISTVLRPTNITVPSAIDPDNWQTVVNAKAYVYSAFLDRSSGSDHSLIRILGTLAKDELVMTDSTKSNNYSCRLWYFEEETWNSKVVTVKVVKIRRLAAIMK